MGREDGLVYGLEASSVSPGVNQIRSVVMPHGRGNGRDGNYGIYALA